MSNKDYNTYYDLLHRKPPSIEEEKEGEERKFKEEIKSIEKLPEIDEDTKAFLDIFKYVFQPSYATKFDKTSVVDYSVNTWQDLASFTMPGGCKGLLKHVGMDSSATSSLIYWRLLINTVPFRDYESINRYPKDYLVQYKNFEYVTLLNPNDVVTLQTQRTTASGTTYGYGRIQGWYWKI